MLPGVSCAGRPLSRPGVARELKPAKIFRLAFRDRGRLIDSPQHELFQRWAARDKPE